MSYLKLIFIHTLNGTLVLLYSYCSMIELKLALI